MRVHSMITSFKKRDKEEFKNISHYSSCARARVCVCVRARARRERERERERERNSINITLRCLIKFIVHNI